MSIKPLHDRILVQRLEEETTTKGGIIIPDNAKEKPTKGKIVEVGTGSKDENGKTIPLDVKKGDTILFAKWGGTEISFEGQDYLIMKESDILAILEGKAAKAKAA